MPSVAEWWKNETFIPLDWSPPPVPAADRPQQWTRWLGRGVVVLLLATSAGLGWLAWHEHTAAQKDEALVHVQATQLQKLQSQVRVLSSQTAQLGALQSQIARERQLLSSATTVSGELQACIDASGKASNDFFGFLTGSQKKADSICNTAEADYQQLLSGSGSAP